MISTNGTLIDSKTAGLLKKVGLSYVGISLDGMEEVNDSFRGVKGRLPEGHERDNGLSGRRH